MSEANTPNNLPQEPLNDDFEQENTLNLTPLEIGEDPGLNSPVDLSQETDWFSQAREYRQRNQKLIQKVAELEQALAEIEEALQSEVLRSRCAETLVSQQVEEIDSEQEQITRLLDELESFHQTVQRQQILIETLSEQFEASQERVAKLERECAQLQQCCNEKTHQLLQIDNTCQDLRSRLHWQERQTLQFKAALNKCLEVTEQDSHLRDTFTSTTTEQLESQTSADLLDLKTEPIQPWSTENDSPQADLADHLNLEISQSIGDSDTVEGESTLEEEKEQPQDNTDFTSETKAVERLINLEALQLNKSNASVSEPAKETHSESEVAAQEEAALPEPNWPSPVIDPVRSQKPKSKATIELPKFPPYRPS